MHARLFPPVASVRALEAAVRLGSFSAAALELGISQSAVSQGVRQLERQLGVEMFVRGPGRVTPNDAGRRYAAAVAPALEAMRAAAQALQPAGAQPVAFGCSRALLNHWLLPRLGRFDGEVDVVGLDRTPSDFAGLHVAVVNGGDSPPFPGARRLRPERLVAVGASELVAGLGRPLEAAPSLEDVRLLGSGWDLWRQATGATTPPEGRVRLRETSALAAAARAKEGFVLLPSLVCADDLAAGVLGVASNVAVNPKRSYWLIEPNGRQAHAASFVDWLIETFRAA